MAALNIYCTNVGRNRRVSTHFAKGSGGKIVAPAPLRDGAVFMYGCLRGLLPTLRQAQAENREWYYCDNAYFGRDQFFRVTRCALQHDGTGTAGPERWNRLGLEIKPWRESGSHIVVCPPSPIFGELWGMDPAAWLARVLAELKRCAERPIRVRTKASAEPLAGDLAGSWALVTYTSNAAVEALLAGVPVFCSAPCAAYRMGTPDLSRIEDPVLPDDREQWAWNLSANQWTIAEMRDGTCWRELMAR